MTPSALQNNDPESYLKTAAYLDDPAAETFLVSKPVTIRGTAMVGWPGLERVEYWLRPEAGTHGKIADDDPAWKSSKSGTAAMIDPPPAEWGGGLPGGLAGSGLGPRPRRPAEGVAMRHSVAAWSGALEGAEARRLRVPGADRRQERLRPARSAALPEVGPQRGRVQAIRRHGLGADCADG